MASTKIVIPDFNFAAFYYPQILEALLQYKRRNVPELTDESEFEPSIQLLRAFACVGHLNNALIDLVANESALPTAKLAESVRNMLRLIDYEMASATPAQVELVYELAQIPSSAVEVVAATAQAATRRTDTQPAVYFEVNEALVCTPGNAFGAVFADESGTFTDLTAGANASAPFVPWTTPAIGDALYFGHATLMWDKLALGISSGASGITGVWEYYDGEWAKAEPDSVTVIGGDTLRVALNGLLGDSSRVGTTIRVTLNSSGAYEEATSQWNGSDNFVDVGLLGQSTPSTTTSEYSVGSDWTELPDISDGTNQLSETGDLEYSLPQSEERNWQPGVVNSQTMYWLRFRIVATSAPAGPTVATAALDEGKQYAIRLATQGVTTIEDPLGSSTGLPDQEFETSNDNFIAGSAIVTVDGEEWTQVGNFLSSTSGDKHYAVRLGESDRATVVFGSGNAGKIPPIGVNNIGVTYRYGAQHDGNVGANTVTVDKTGLTLVNKIWNPRSASGWKEAEGASESSLARAKVAGPASLRTLERALGPDDVELLVQRTYRDDLGSNPFARSRAIEEGVGPKTVELVLVLKGGGVATADQLAAVATWFNGDKFSSPPKPKRIVANQEVVPFNYTPRVIDITAVVTSKASATAIAERLRQVFQPEALEEDGVTYTWDFGGEVPLSRINHEIFKAASSKKVVLTNPPADIQLGPRELPKPGVISITVIEP